MSPSLFSLLNDKNTQNGTRALLTEIRAHQPDMPAEVRDDVTFGALVVIYDMGVARGKKLKMLEKWSILYGGLIILVALTIVSLHTDVPWLTGLLEHLFGG